MKAQPARAGVRKSKTYADVACLLHPCSDSVPTRRCCFRNSSRSAEACNYVKVHKINALRHYERRLSSKLASLLFLLLSMARYILHEGRSSAINCDLPPRTISVLARATDPLLARSAGRKAVKSPPRHFAAAPALRTPLIPERENGP